MPVARKVAASGSSPGYWRCWGAVRKDFWRTPLLLRTKSAIDRGDQSQVTPACRVEFHIFFPLDYPPSISLRQGDLWHGNAALDESGMLALFYPAAYFGDRAADLAMSESYPSLYVLGRYAGGWAFSLFSFGNLDYSGGAV